MGADGFIYAWAGPLVFDEADFQHAGAADGSNQNIAVLGCRNAENGTIVGASMGADDGRNPALGGVGDGVEGWLDFEPARRGGRSPTPV